MTKPLTKVRICPTCGVGYKSSQVIDGGRPGWRCPQWHFHTAYELQRHEAGKPLNVDLRRKAEKSASHGDFLRSPAGRRREAAVDRYRQDRADLLALMWVGAMDALLAQMPERSLARQMIEGATAQAYRVSRQILDEQAGQSAGRMAA